MKRKIKIKKSPSMIIASITPVVTILISVFMLLLLLVPDGKEIVTFDDETAIKESAAYPYAIRAIETILNDDHIQELLSVSFFQPDLDDFFEDTNIKVVYSNGSQEISRYFKGSYSLRHGKAEYTFHEIDEKQYRANTRIMLVKSLVTDWKDKDIRIHTYDEFATNVLLSHVKEAN